ncbi:hypothetical protein IKA15_03390 [bacterium]|nr:hypothetical protein [bacterium]
MSMRIQSFGHFVPKKETAPKHKERKEFEAIGALAVGAGVALSLALIQKNKGIKIGDLKGKKITEKIAKVWKSFDIDYDVKDLFTMATGAIGAGLIYGFAKNKDKTFEGNKEKLKETVHAYATFGVPTALTAATIGILGKTKIGNKPLGQIIPIVVGVGAGMPIAHESSNWINEKIDKNSEHREMKLKDYFIHIDDIIAVLILAKVPFARKIQAGRLLPIIYGMLGYEVATKKERKALDLLK